MRLNHSNLDLINLLNLTSGGGGASCGPQELSLHLLGQMEDLRLMPDTISYSAALSACEKCREWERTLQLLAQMRQRGVPLDAVSCSAAISACRNGQEWGRALDVLQEMRLQGIKLDAIAFNAAISACDSGFQWERALLLLAEMTSRRISPTVVTCNAAISACERGQRLQEALEVMDDMQRAGLQADVVTFGAAISACSGGQAWSRVLALLEEMGRLSVEPDLVVQSAVAHTCTLAGSVDSAPEVLDSLGCRVTELLEPLKATEGANPFAVAVELLDQHGRLGQATAEAYRSSVYGMALPCLWRACRPLKRGGREPLLGAALERQSCLGAAATGEALATLQLARRGGWRPGAQRSAFAASLAAEGLESLDELAAKGIAVWVAAALSGVGSLGLRGRPFGHNAGLPRGGALVPVFVDHDRSLHAERRRLILMLLHTNTNTIE